MRLTPDEISEWKGHRFCAAPAGREVSGDAGDATLGRRLEGARLLADQLGRRLPALRALLDHQISLIESGLCDAALGIDGTESLITTTEQEKEANP